MSGESFAIEAARRLLDLPPEGATLALVGPALVYGDDEMLSFMVVRGIPRRSHLNTSVELGRLVADPMDDPLAQHFDTVLHLRRANELTMSEGRELRAAFIRELERAGTRVVDCATERELTGAYVRSFPGERSRKLRAAFETEGRQ